MSEIDSSNGIANILTPSIRPDNTGSSLKKSGVVEETSDTVQEKVYKKSNEDDQEQQSFINTVQDNLDKINEFLPVTSTNLSFEFSEEDSAAFIRVIDKDNNEVIREIPSEEFREVAKALDEFADKLVNKGVLLDETV
ncbi:flagellar biosynthesis protein FlaG [Pseudoalteromonas citrea]|uniref:Flagellar biosynthesis protein FlaG n=1 Tax=Pseudoalteromonas citrea TaxID=43655 RepID=A0A5S3XWB0_9GAMM|nr:flagellar protein FlaG [Pseudoalteromonas citrea]TMP41637.1 flagellar biosynthesis protein FlaG [Pseudoalteromonas citrea]TMP62537.1 flagellar biosynthesis protein FlaG [Pseudoalteromonas citrea]